MSRPLELRAHNNLITGSLNNQSAESISPYRLMSQRSHAAPSKLLGTFAAQTLAARYDAGPSAADWRRFGRLPGFTNCKPKYRKLDGLFPFV